MFVTESLHVSVLKLNWKGKGECKKYKTHFKEFKFLFAIPLAIKIFLRCELA